MMGAAAIEKETDGQASESERMCALSRDVLPVSDLLRFVADPDNKIVPDIRRKLPGRGVNLRGDAATLRDAIKRKVFERSLKRAVTVPASLIDDVRRLLVSDLVQSLAMANKAGFVITGFSKVESALDGRKVAALLQASDAAADGVRKLRQATSRGYGARAENLPVIACLSSADFQLALGRDIVIHAALLPGPAVGALLDRWRRLVRFDGPAAQPGAGFETDAHAAPSGEAGQMNIPISNDKPAGHTAE
ncbi:MAG: RNA-binding protein [Bosea sp. (in: a-proteobacteria)]